MLVETQDLVTARHAADLAGVTFVRFQEFARLGSIKPFVAIDGLSFYHRSEVLAFRRYVETMDGKRPSRPLPRMQELF